MIKYFWDKIKKFIISQSRLSRTAMVMVLVVAVIGIFGFVQPVQAAADVMMTIANIFANIFLLIAALLGQILVLIIGLLLDVISYNNFVDATAVNYGWTVVRDICNLFFVLILLVIGFGSILRLENFKYNQLLGKLIIMIVLVNFSKMIAGFFIDISQVVLLTFSNAFAATAAGNFTSALKLKEMLGFVEQGANGQSVEVITNGLSAMDVFSLALLPAILMIVAIFTMVAMLVVFLARIIILWILVVLSPLAYLMSVLPSTQQYSKQWWSHFVKWVVTGPVLAFFIWFGLTLIAGGGINPQSFELENQQIIQGASTTAGAGDLAVGIGRVSSSDSLLQFTMAIGMFVISLITAQSLGGIAGSFSGKVLGKLQTMGGAALKYTALARYGALGARELAKMGGRKIRREVRDRTPLGALANVFKGAKQRGESVEKRSQDVALARGRDLWDKRPRWAGGGAEPVSTTLLTKAKYTREAAAELAGLQKEQKADQLKTMARNGNKGLDNVTQRQGMVLAQASTSHIDDALATPYFMKEQPWKDEYGQSYKGFSFYDVTDEELEVAAKEKNIDMGNKKEMNKLRKRMRYDAPKEKRTAFRDAEATNDFMSVMVSKDFNTDPKKIDESAARILYDAENMMMGNKHFYASGTAKYQEEFKRLARVNDMKDQREIANTEFNKQQTRNVIGAHNHNYSVQYMSPENENMYIIPRKKRNSMENDFFAKLSGIVAGNPGEYFKHGLPRHEEFLGKFDPHDRKHEIFNTPIFWGSLGQIYKHAADLANQNEDKTGQTGYKMFKRDANGKLLTDVPAEEYDDLEDFRQKFILPNILPKAQKDYEDLVEKQRRNPKSVSQFELKHAQEEYESIRESWGEKNEKYKHPTKYPRKKGGEKKDTKTEGQKGRERQGEPVTSDIQKEVRVELLENQTNDMGASLNSLNVAIKQESLEKFSELISRSLSDVELSDNGLDTATFEKKLGEISKTFEEALADATPAEQTEFINKYKNTTDELGIGTISEKTLQIRVINALNNLSKILNKK